MRPINLEPMRKFIEAQMVDRVNILRPHATDEGTWDPDKGRLVLPTTDLIYDGPAFIANVARRPHQLQDAGQRTSVGLYKLGIPLDGPDIVEHDFVEFVDSLREQALVGQMFNVKTIQVTTFAVARTAVMELWDGDRQR